MRGRVAGCAAPAPRAASGVAGGAGSNFSSPLPASVRAPGARLRAAPSLIPPAAVGGCPAEGCEAVPALLGGRRAPCRPPRPPRPLVLAACGAWGRLAPRRWCGSIAGPLEAGVELTWWDWGFPEAPLLLQGGEKCGGTGASRTHLPAPECFFVCLFLFFLFFPLFFFHVLSPTEGVL